MSELGTALPRITIEFCTQCKWMLRAAYFAQELLSTFSTSLGEVALQPSTGGTFIVHLYHAAPRSESSLEGDATRSGSGAAVQKHLLWDRKAEGRFPETKELKRRVRDIIDPTRHLGHVDSHTQKAISQPEGSTTASNNPPTSNAKDSRSGGGPAGSEPAAENQNGGGDEKVVISGRDKVFYCRPGDEDCG